MRTTRRAGWGLAFVLLLILSAPMALAGASSTTVVVPTGVAEQDVANVQAAVDAGGTVLLRATGADGNPAAFNFGSNELGGGYVDLTADVAIEGEVDGLYATTISGGYAPFRGWADQPVATRISSLTFESPGVAALFVTGSTDLEFTNNRVTDVVALQDWMPGIDKGQAVWIVGTSTVTGRVVVSDNVIDNVLATNGYGIALYGHSADARIERNEISGVSTAAILSGVNLGNVRVADNMLMPGPPRAPLPYGWGGGIIIGNSLGGRSYVTGNTIECENPDATSILVAASAAYGEIQDGAVVTSNIVTMHDSQYGAITLAGSVTNTYVGQNTIRGKGGFAFSGEPYLFADESVASNVFVGNNIGSFHSSVADVHFFTNTAQNAYFGKVKTAIDLGEANWISGLDSGRPPESPTRRDQNSQLSSRTWDSAGQTAGPPSLNP